MSDISPYTQEIQNAVYGEQVRSSIINALNKVNDDNNSYSQIKTDILNAKSAVDAQVESFNGKVENAQTTLNSLQSKVSEANTAKTNLTNATNTANTAKNNLISATNSANTAKTNLQTATTNANTATANANTAKSNLETATANANTAKTDVTSATTNANTAKSALNTSIQSANTANSNLENTISSANTAKNNLQTVINSSGTAKSNLSDVIVQAGTAQTNLEGATSTANTSHSQLVEENATAKKNIEDLRSENFDAQEVLTGLLKVYPTETVEGNPVSFVDGADNIPIKSLKINIEPVQDGTGDPSPTNIRPISGWDSVKLTRVGKNLLKPPTVSTSEHNGISFTYMSDGGIVCNGTSTGVAYSATQNGFRLPVGQYVKNTQSSDGIGVIVQTKTSPNWTTVQGGGVSDRTVTISAEDTLYDLAVRIRIPSGITLNDYVYYPMLRLTSDTEETYEPYNGNTYEISLSDAGTVYGGTLDVLKGELVVDRKMVTVDVASPFTFESSYNTNNQYKNALFGFNSPDAKQPKNTDILMNTICDKFKTLKYNQLTSKNNEYEGIAPVDERVSASAIVRVSFPKSKNIVTLADANAWLANNPFTVVYELATPIVYTLTPQQVTSVLGKNNVWSDAGSVDVEYRTDIKLYIEKRLAELTA